MKKTAISLILVFITMTTFAQNIPNSITVNGEHEYVIKPEFEAKMILSLANVYYDAPGMTLPDLKSTYLNNLEKAGISKSSISEDELAYAIMGYEKEGTVIKLKTKSTEEMKKFLNVRGLGVTKSDANLSYVLSNEEMANYTKLAYEDAKAKAMAMAEKIGRKVGKALYITNSNSNETVESIYYATEINNRKYNISVSFELL